MGITFSTQKISMSFSMIWLDSVPLVSGSSTILFIVLFFFSKRIDDGEEFRVCDDLENFSLDQQMKYTLKSQVTTSVEFSTKTMS